MDLKENEPIEPHVVTASGRVFAPATPEEPKKPRARGVVHRTGFYRKTLSEDEIPVFEAIYEALYEKIKDLDPILDDALVVEFVKNSVMLQRKPAPPTEGVGNKNVYDYTMARSKLVLQFADALGLTRKQRVDRETANGVEDILKKFFKDEGKGAQNRADRTKVTVAKPKALDADGNVKP
jgi:acyl-[acyl carrier protein]--UDP-N-acetylglucosamine O-acyltransferase